MLTIDEILCKELPGKHK